jgi:nucleoside 2-deoxyribosyltransferase
VIYLASPLSHPSAELQRQRFEAACRAAARLIRAGKQTFSPVAHSYPIAQHGLPMDWAFWETSDRRHLEACNEMVVLMLEGWRKSAGIRAEIAIARQLGKPISYLVPLAEENPGWGRG